MRTLKKRRRVVRKPASPAFTIDFGDGTDNDSWIRALSGLIGCVVEINGDVWYVVSLTRDGDGAAAVCEPFDADGRRRHNEGYGRLSDWRAAAGDVLVPLTPGMTITYC